ncbi:MAG: PP2C family protein-serine/threonine phosphatase [Planctomycetes bacterium]|nr:PP2C family protein-serine/threonine phosphatase [Planctomycetota bacterium]
MFVMVVDSQAQGLPEGTLEMLGDIGCGTTVVPDFESALSAAQKQSLDAIILREPARDLQERLPDSFRRLMQVAANKRMATLLLTSAGRSPDAVPQSLVDAVPIGVSLDELRGRFTMIDRYQEYIKRLETELKNMERLGKQLNEHFREVDQEMRLAARLQSDFLPDLHDPIGNVQFATLYRPATWVSGDIFDVFRIDEKHTGFYVADAVGHGLAAGLLTMFIMRSIVPKLVDDDRYDILSPSTVLENLNIALVDQSLPHCQFVTACYGLINHETGLLQYSRGGHPYPILISHDGFVSDLKTQGGLLGLFREGDFPVFETTLQKGDKLLLYTDGVELAFQPEGSEQLDVQAYYKSFEEFADLSVRDMVSRLNARLEHENGSLNPRDDVTIVALEIIG